MADKGLGGDRSPSLAAAGGRGREAPGEEEEEGSGARAAAGTLGPGQQLSARSWQALGSPGSELRPFSRLPPSPLSSLSSSSLRPPWTWAAGCGPEGPDADGEDPRGRRGCAEGSGPEAHGRAPGGVGGAGGSPRPQPLALL